MLMRCCGEALWSSITLNPNFTTLTVMVSNFFLQYGLDTMAPSTRQGEYLKFRAKREFRLNKPKARQGAKRYRVSLDALFSLFSLDVIFHFCCHLTVSLRSCSSFPSSVCQYLGPATPCSSCLSPSFLSIILAISEIE